MTYAPPFWLSHHRAEEADRCFTLGTVHVCARCLGTYPVLLGVLAAQLVRPLAPASLPLDPWIFFVLPIPAVVDWSLGQITRWHGSNLLRLASGALLGGALGRSVYVHLRRPQDPRVYAQLLGLCAVAGIVWGLRQKKSV